MGPLAVLLIALCLQQDSRRLIEELRSSEASERERAERALRSIGRAALPQLEEASREVDQEVARRARFLCRAIAWDEKITPRMKKASPGLADRLALDGNPEAAKALVKVLGSESIRLRHPELRREDLDPLIAAALRGASSDDDLEVLCDAVERRRLASAAPELVSLLRGRSSSVRGRSFRALLDVGSRAQVPALEALSREGDGQEQEHALFLLGRLGATELIPRFVELMKDPSAYVRNGARWALQDLGMGGRSGDLLALLRYDHPMVRHDALIVVRTLGMVEAVPEIVPLLKDESPSVRYWAVMALEQFSPPGAASRILPLLRDGDQQVRGLAAEKLGEREVKEAIPPLIDTLKDPQARVRKQAADALRRLNATEAVPALERLIEDADGDVQGAAMEALAAIRGREAVPALLTVLRSKQHDELRASAAVALASIGARDGVPELLRLLESPFDIAIHRALMAAGALKLREAIPAAVRLLTWRDWIVRSSALKTIGDIGAAEAESAVVGRLADADGSVRRSAALCLCRLGSRKGVELMLEQSENLFELNLLRSPAILKTLGESTVPCQFGATREGVVERIAKEHGWTVEFSASEELQTWKKGPAWAWLVEGGRRTVDVLRGVMGDRWAIVLDGDRIRVLSRAEAERFWTGWVAEK